MQRQPRLRRSQVVAQLRDLAKHNGGAVSPRLVASHDRRVLTSLRLHFPTFALACRAARVQVAGPPPRSRLRRPPSSPVWSQARIVDELRRLAGGGASTGWAELMEHGAGGLVNAAVTHAGGLQLARADAGVHAPERLKPLPRWNQAAIADEIRARARAGQPLAASRAPQRFVAAARWHYGTWEAALAAAGVDASTARLQRAPYTRDEILELIRTLARDGKPVRPSTLKPLVKLDSIRKLFGSIDAAIREAGIEQITTHGNQKWSRERVIAELQARAARGETTLTRGLHRAVQLYFGGAHAARQAAGLEPLLRTAWTRETLARELQHRARRGDSNRSLWSACKRLFGSVAAARAAAGVPPPARSSGMASWDRDHLLRELRRRRRTGQQLCRGLVEGLRREFGTLAAARAALQSPAPPRRKRAKPPQRAPRTASPPTPETSRTADDAPAPPGPAATDLARAAEPPDPIAELPAMFAAHLAAARARATARPGAPHTDAPASTEPPDPIAALASALAAHLAAARAHAAAPRPGSVRTDAPASAEPPDRVAELPSTLAAHLAAARARTAAPRPDGPRMDPPPGAEPPDPVAELASTLAAHLAAARARATARSGAPHTDAPASTEPPDPIAELPAMFAAHLAAARARAAAPRPDAPRMDPPPGAEPPDPVAELASTLAAHLAAARARAAAPRPDAPRMDPPPGAEPPDPVAELAPALAAQVAAARRRAHPARPGAARPAASSDAAAAAGSSHSKATPAAEPRDPIADLSPALAAQVAAARARAATPWTPQRIRNVLRQPGVDHADPELVAACIDHFGSVTAARAAAERQLRRRQWTKELVIAELQARSRRGLEGVGRLLRDPAIRLFGSTEAALHAAAHTDPRSLPRTRAKPSGPR